MRVAVVGAGAVGARAARQLLGMDEVDEVVVHDPEAARRDAVVASLGERARSGTEPVPAEGDDLAAVVVAVPAGQGAPVAASAVRAGRHAVVVCDAVEDVQALLDLDHEAAERDCSVVVGAGFSPGLSCVLARHAAGALDAVDEVHVARFGTGGPACARQHHTALSGSSLDWRDGGWVRRPAGSGRELCWFPDPIGGRDCYRAALPDSLLLVPAFPGVARVTARLAANRRDRLTSRLPMLRQPHPEGGPGALRVEVRGRSGRATDTRVLGAMDHPAVAAGAVAALAVQRVVSGDVLRRGAGGLATTVEPLGFLQDLRTRGVRAAAFEGAGSP